MGATALCQPGGQRQQARRRGVERTHFALGCTVAHHTNTRHHRVLVNVEPRTPRVEYVHGSLRLLRRRRRASLDQNLNNALPSLAALGAIGGALDAPGSTNTRARSHHRTANLSASGRKTMPQVSCLAGRCSGGKLILIALGHKETGRTSPTPSTKEATSLYPNCRQ